uniref:Helicase C-terminal domain-containing protein n=1 Tax=viral metagenome TaxID=1070528 RepID=A0A6C0DL38_9ZZZZ
MKKGPFNPFLALEKKEMSNEPEKIEIKLKPQKIEIAKEPILKKVKEVEKEVEKEVDEKFESNVEIMRVEPVTIIDKSKNQKINRNVFLDRLRKDNIFVVKEDKLQLKPSILNTMDVPVPSPTISFPKKTDERIVLREKRIEPTIELKKDEIEKEVVEDVFEIQPTSNQKDFEQLVELTEPVELEETAISEIIEEEIVEKTKPIKEKKKKNEKTEKKTTKPRKLKVVGETIDLSKPLDLTTALIHNQNVIERLPKEREHIIIKAPTYYMNNRKIYVQKLTNLLNPYLKELLANEESVSCESRSQNDNFDLLTHQKIVRDYLNLYTPYRGLLLYHGLGSGKTCTSIALAEGMKSDKRVFILTPASLKMNFFSEMKKCGDPLYKKNQVWEFIEAHTTKNPEYINILSKTLQLPIDFIIKKRGAWLLNVKASEPKYTDLTTEQQLEIDEQLNAMIRTKYTDINYNGMNIKKMELLTGNFTHNPFDNAVVIIDEAHNFVSRIVNKIKKKDSISYMLYDYLMKATNARVVLLTGTPIINYPNEIGVLFNILRGYIKTWSLRIFGKTSEPLNTDTILNILDKENFRTYDYVEFSDNKLSITRNPFGFINSKKRGPSKGTQKAKPNLNKQMERQAEKEEKPKTKKTTKKQLGGASKAFERYDGVHLDETGNMSDTEFIDKIITILSNPKYNLDVQRGSAEVTLYKALPDDTDSFLSMFVDEDTGNAKNINLFQRRILGLTSYFRSAQEQLLPSYVKTASGDIYHIVKTDMSPQQFGIYEKIRKQEADREKKANKNKRRKAGKDEEMYNISSTYRIFSRAACNFTFPASIERPVPNLKENQELKETDFDAIPKEQQSIIDDYEFPDEEQIETEENEEEMKTYIKRIEKALKDVSQVNEETNESMFLSKSTLPIISPKFSQILENLSNPENEGLHLLYSHFRTIEGIGIMKLILEANGFAEFKIAKNNDLWTIVEKDEDINKPKFVLYTGTETAEEKEIIRNIYNGMWDFVPLSIANKLRERSENNMYGEAIKIIMITSSGAEGINLRNTRFVHIVEPYWNMVRIEQVVGRARRICSHQDLPVAMRNVKVFLYLTQMSEQQKTDEKNIEIRIRDLSRIDKKTPVTTDETLFEIASLKQKINNQILQAVKETAVDCNLYSLLTANNKDSKEEQLVCYGFGKIESNQFSSYPSLDKDRDEKSGLDVETVRWAALEVEINGEKYALNEDTNELYNFKSYEKALTSGSSSELVKIGILKYQKGKYEIIYGV